MPEPGPFPQPPAPDSQTYGSAAPPVTGIDRLRALLEVLACSGVPTQFGIAAALHRLGMSPLEPGGQLSATFVFTLSLFDALAVAALALLLLKLSDERPRDVFLGPRPARREAVIGAALIPIVFCIVLVILGVLRHLTPWLHNVEDNPLERLLSSPGRAAVFALVGIVAGGLREEVQRAFVLHRFEQYLGGPAFGLLVVSVAFGAGHIVQGWDAAVTTGVLGAFWGALYLTRRSAVAPIVSHAGFNTTEILRVVLMGGH